MLAAALLHDRDRLAHFAVRFEVAQQDHRVGEIARIHRGLHRRADQALVRADQNGCHALLPEIRQQLVQLDGEELLLRASRSGSRSGCR